MLVLAQKGIDPRMWITCTDYWSCNLKKDNEFNRDANKMKLMDQLIYSKIGDQIELDLILIPIIIALQSPIVELVETNGQ